MTGAPFTAVGLAHVDTADLAPMDVPGPLQWRASMTTPDVLAVNTGRADNVNDLADALRQHAALLATIEGTAVEYALSYRTHPDSWCAPVPCPDGGPGWSSIYGTAYPA
jgi:hypothetical protein